MTACAPKRISVAMATYNGARFLREQLESIAAQTLKPFELVICDDRSADATVRIAEEFARDSPFPVYVQVNDRNLGYFRNFRAAASLCRGDLIAFSDQDDWWLPERLQKCVGHFEDPDLLLLYHNAWLVDADRRRIGTVYDRVAEERAINLQPIGPWNHSYGLVQIFRSRLREFDDLWDMSLNHMVDPLDIMCHDQWYFFLAEALGRVDFLDEPLLEYRQHGANAVSAKQIRPAVETRLLARLQHFGGQDLRMSEAASARADVLENMAKRCPSVAPRLLHIADHYRLLSDRNSRRYRTYAGSNIGERLLNLARSWSGGDYADWPWGFDRRSVIRDLWSGVLLARVEPRVN